MKYTGLFLLLFFSLFGYSQVQIGNDINGQQIRELFGRTVSLSGDGKTLAIGAPHYEDNWNTNKGRVQVYRLYSSGSWNQMGQDLNSNYAASSSGYFGATISLSSDGEVLACAGKNFTLNGVDQLAIQVYHLNVLGNWSQITNDIILPTDNTFVDSYHQIISLSADGNILAVGNPGLAINGQFSGQVKIFRNVSGTWVQLGQDINGNSVNEDLGYSVSLSGNGNVLAVSTINGVEIYRNSSLISPNWKSIGSIFNTNGVVATISLSSSGSVVAVSSPVGLNSMGVSSGYVAVYGYKSGSWLQLGQNIEGTFPNENFGVTNSLSADGRIIAIGRTGTSVFNVSDSLQAQVYQYVSGTWTQLHGNINGYSFREDDTSVSLSGDGSFVAVGSFEGNGSPPGTGYVRVFDTTQPVSSRAFVLEFFTVYPNPTTDILNISLDNNLVLEKVTVYNSLGQIVKTAYGASIDMSGLAKGLYFLEVTTPEGKAVKKVILE